MALSRASLLVHGWLAHSIIWLLCYHVFCSCTCYNELCLNYKAFPWQQDNALLKYEHFVYLPCGQCWCTHSAWNSHSYNSAGVFECIWEIVPNTLKIIPNNMKIIPTLSQHYPKIVSKLSQKMQNEILYRMMGSSSQTDFILLSYKSTLSQMIELIIAITMVKNS